MNTLDTAATPSPGRALATIDLDRTLIYSAAAIAEGAADPAAAAALSAAARCVEIYQGRPQSFMSPAAMAMLTELAARAEVVPTTTRTIEQYRRITLPIGTPRFAITSNGGNILVNGVRDEAWSRQVSDLLGTLGAGVDAVYERLGADAAGAPWLRTMRIADGLFCYVVVELELLPPQVVPAWASWAAERGWNVSRQGRKIYVMPDPVTKQLAVDEVRTRLPHVPSSSYAAGDGVLDQPMLVGADAAIRPRHGELEELGWRHSNVAVTDERGLAASEEMLTWLLRRAGTMVNVDEPDKSAFDRQVAGVIGADKARRSSIIDNSTPNEGLR